MTALSQPLCGCNLKIHMLANCNGKNTVIYRIHTYSKIGPQYLPRKGHFSSRMYGLHVSSSQCTMQQHVPYTLHKSATFRQIYIDMTTNTTPPQTLVAAYALCCLSRVTSLSGLYLKDLNEEKICIS